MGEILIDRHAGSISFPAELNMDTGLLEYLLVRTGGKTHESLLRTKTQPYHLQLACLLLGMEGTRAPLAAQGAPEPPDGEPVEITLELSDGRVVAPEGWMLHSVAGVKKDIARIRWVFTGSLVHDGSFAAQADGSIIAVYHDPVAMIDNASPGGEDDRIWYVRDGAVPPAGTPVTVVIRALR